MNIVPALVEFDQLQCTGWLCFGRYYTFLEFRKVIHVASGTLFLKDERKRKGFTCICLLF